MRRPSPLLPVILVLLPAQLAAQGTPSSPRAVAGCYALSVGSWSPAPAPEPAVRIPPRIVLDTVRVVGTAFRARPAPGPEGGAYTPGIWAPLGAGDSLRIAWPAGGGGVEARLRVEGGTLRGRAAPLGGTAASPTAEVTARRVEPCPVSTATEIAGLEARGASASRPPETGTATPADTPSVRAAAVPAEQRPPGRAERIAGWTLAGVLAWMLGHLVGIL